VQAKINRGRHTDHPAGRHSIRTKQCPPPSSEPNCLKIGYLQVQSCLRVKHIPVENTNLRDIHENILPFLLKNSFIALTVILLLILSKKKKCILIAKYNLYYFSFIQLHTLGGTFSFPVHELLPDFLVMISYSVLMCH